MALAVLARVRAKPQFDHAEPLRKAVHTMSFATFLRSWKGTRMENRFHRVALLCMSVAVLMLSLKALWQEQVVVLVPATLSEPLKVSKRGVGEQFAKTWGVSLALLLGNVSPDNAEFVKKTVGSMLDPAIHQEVMAVVEKQVEEIRQDRVSQSFEANTTVYEHSTNRIFVTGRAVMRGPTGKQEGRERTFEFEIVAENYRPQVRFLSTYKGPPKTESVLARDEKAEERQRQRDRKASSQGHGTDEGVGK